MELQLFINKTPEVSGRFVYAVVRVLGLLPFVLLMSCGTPNAIIGVENPDISVDSVPGATVQKIFVASTRAPSFVDGELYSELRSRDLSLASVNVTIPPNHEVGKVERPKQIPPDPRTEFTVIDPVIYGSDTAFVREVNQALADWPRDKRDVLLFIHGYNTSTTDAVLRLAQFVHDSGYEGIPVLFTWASANQTAKYVYDLNSALIAREQVATIADLLDRTNASGYDVFAHSMGTFLTMEGLLDRSQEGKINRAGRLNNVVLASPDIDADLFRSQIARLEQRPENFFILLSRDDRALAVSRFIAGGVTRLGASETDDLTDLGITIVDLTEVDDRSSLSHSKFASSPEIVQVIGNGLNRSATFDEEEAEVRAEDLLLRLSVRVLF